MLEINPSKAEAQFHKKKRAARKPYILKFYDWGRRTNNHQRKKKNRY